jgi:hypothetical protein
MPKPRVRDPILLDVPRFEQPDEAGQTRRTQVSRSS